MIKDKEKGKKIEWDILDKQNLKIRRKSRRRKRIGKKKRKISWIRRGEIKFKKRGKKGRKY